MDVLPATVKKHLEHVYDKLGVHTRTAAAAAAFRRPVLARIQQLRELVARGRAELNAKRAREEAQERPA